MLIGILQAGHLNRDDTPFPEYDELYPAMLKGHGFDFKTWSVVDMEFPEDPHEAHGWLIGGSRHGAYEDLPFIQPLEDFIAKAYAKSVPLVGICFGHQIIAQALGGRVAKFDGGWAVGRHDYDFEGEPMVMNAWHQDQVVEKPARAERIGTSPFCENAALLYDGKALTVQAHPEFEADVMQPLLGHRAPGVVPDLLIAEARMHVGAANDNARMADRIAAFFKENAHV
ncbi:MAG: type 1 glutamine amidotransferase [Paracoccaceae bacterium]|nr:type 1 glutamine amidotransferase [Paracoccaceae bacterium]